MSVSPEAQSICFWVEFIGRFGSAEPRIVALRFAPMRSAFHSSFVAKTDTNLSLCAPPGRTLRCEVSGRAEVQSAS